MDIPHRGSRPAVALPEIYVDGSNPSDRFRNSSRSSSYNSASSPSTTSGPMPIRNARDPIPPPLPPPRHLEDIGNGPDIAWQWGNSHEESSWERTISSVAPGSSLYGRNFANKESMMDDRPEFVRRTSSTSTVKSITGLERQENSYPRLDEGYASLSGTSVGSNRSVLTRSQSILKSTFNVHKQPYLVQIVASNMEQRQVFSVPMPSLALKPSMDFY
jgi:hypothetical protein